MSNDKGKTTQTRAQALMAKGVALWNLIIKSGIDTSMGLKVRDGYLFENLDRSEQLLVIRLVQGFEAASAAIEAALFNESPAMERLEKAVDKLEASLETTDSMTIATDSNTDPETPPAT